MSMTLSRTWRARRGETPNDGYGPFPAAEPAHRWSRYSDDARYQVAVDLRRNPRPWYRAAAASVA
jgi:hypothetical protein